MSKTTSILKEQVGKRRTFAIISHPDAGKTTLTEQLLLYGGAIRLAGAVKNKKAARQATSDWMEIEKQRGISVTSSVMQFTYHDVIINLLDTPGHEDFSDDTYRTLTAADSALMVIDVAKGVEERTVKLMEVCRLRKLPIYTFINKLDRDGRCPLELLDEVESVLNIRCAPITWPIGMGHSLKGIYHLYHDKVFLYQPNKCGVLCDDTMIDGLDNPQLNKLLDKQLDELKEDILLIKGASHSFHHEKYLQAGLTPVFFGTALHNFGIRQLLDDFIIHAPSPHLQQARQREVKPWESSLTGFVFKIQANMDPQHRDRIAFMRVCSGNYQKGIKLYHVRTGKVVKITDALTFVSAERAQVEQAYAGDVIGLHNHGTFNIGDTLTEGERLRFKGIANFAPELFRSAQLQNPMKIKALTKGLEQLCEEGAAQLLKPVIGRSLILGAVGELQFDVIKQRLKTEYQVDCIFEPMSIHTARWVTSDVPDTFAQFKKKLANHLAHDYSGKLVYLASSQVNLTLTIERWPEVAFFASCEYGDDLDDPC